MLQIDDNMRARKRPPYLIWLVCLVAAAGVVFAAYAADKGKTAASGALPVKLREPLTVHTQRGDYAFSVEVVSDPQEMSLGLMFREEVPEKTGMLFDFGAPRRISMWMKNTLAPLDMLFIAPDGEIVDIAKNTTPFSLEPIISERPALAVLEVRAGTCNHYGIAPGDKVKHPLFSP